jgi:hypothetical protein
MPLFYTFPNAQVDFTGDTIKVCLLKNTWTPDRTLSLYSQLSAHETSGAGYTAGGATLTSKTAVRDGRTWTFDAADLAWTSATFACRYAVLYKSSTGALIGYADLRDEALTPPEPSVSNGTLSLQFSVFGLYTKEVS